MSKKIGHDGPSLARVAASALYREHINPKMD